MIQAMFEKFYPGEAVLFLLVCWAAWMVGRAAAKVWEGPVRVVLYCILLAWVVRFLHYALYQGPFIRVSYYLIDFVVLAAVALVSFRYTRTKQMVTQYNWLYERTSPLGWKSK